MKLVKKDSSTYKPKRQWFIRMAGSGYDSKNGLSVNLCVNLYLYYPIHFMLPLQASVTLGI